MRARLEDLPEDADKGRAAIYVCRKYEQRENCLLHRLAADELYVTVVTPKGERINFSVGVKAGEPDDSPDVSHLFRAAQNGGWVDAEGQPPAKDGSYLVCTKNGAVTTARYYTAKTLPCGVNRPAEWQGNRDVAYWMLMPEPPIAPQPPAGAVRVAKLGCKRIWVDENNDFVAEVD